MATPDPKPPTQTIIDQQAAVKARLPFADTQDFDDAAAARVATNVPNKVVNATGRVVWDNDQYSFLSADSPDTANPSLWRQSQLTAQAGLYRVTDKIHQVRGLDLSNVTFIEGDTGVIVIDPLATRECAAAALQLYNDHAGNGGPVKAVIYTHSHVDHFGGVKGMISEADVGTGLVSVIAPEGFLEHAVSENVYAGTAMSRRAAYMYGAALARSPQGQIGAGLAQTVSTGEITLIAPTDTITTTGETRTLDGVTFEFMMAPNTEAPSEMLIYIPSQRALCAAEDATHTFHNLLTLRGAQVRDPHGWARYLTETIDRYAGKTDALFASHHWPITDVARIRPFLTLQRDLYAYVHDQCLRLINKGFTGTEIAEQLVLPPAVDQAWGARGYYGSTSHNAKAVYQRYLGWFDGNPSHLWEHVPVERAKRYVEVLGGMEATMAAGKKAFDGGDFRWAAELLNHAVFADAKNETARYLLADTYEQMGYGAENGPWRNFFISGAVELRTGNFGTPTVSASADVVGAMTVEMVLDSLAIKINGPKGWDVEASLDVVVTDGEQPTYHTWLSNGALIYSTAPQPGVAEVSVTGTAKALTKMAVVGFDPAKLTAVGLVVAGDTAALTRLNALLDPGDPNFNIVTP